MKVKKGLVICWMGWGLLFYGIHNLPIDMFVFSLLGMGLGILGCIIDGVN